MTAEGVRRRLWKRLRPARPWDRPVAGGQAAMSIGERDRQQHSVPSDDGKPTYQCERIELNALTAPAFIAYVEERLTAECSETANKVVPPATVLEPQARERYHRNFDSEVTATVIT